MRREPATDAVKVADFWETTMNKRELTRKAHRMAAELLRGCGLQPGELSETDAAKWVVIVEAMAERHDKLSRGVTMSWREVR